MKADQSADLTNVAVVTIALGRLGGARDWIDIEDVAVEAYEIAPLKFAWKKYPEQIDISTVRYALKNGVSRSPALIIGGIRTGYMLTSEGLELVRELESADIGAGTATARKGSMEADLQEERARLRKTSAFAKFSSRTSESLSERDFNEFARVNDYFPKNLRQKRFLKIDNAVSGDAELDEIWSHLKQEFWKDR